MKALAILLVMSAPALAAVGITKSVHGGQTTAYVGGTVAYDLNFTANGIENNLLIHDPTPPGFTLLTVQSGTSTVDCTTSSGGTLAGATVTCNAGGELQVTGVKPSLVLLVTYRVDAVPAGGTASNTASVTCTTCTVPAPNTAVVAVQAAPLTITKIVDKPTAAPGETVKYTVTVTNSGTQPAIGWTLHDALPTGLKYQSSTPAATVSGNTLDWSPPPLNPSQMFIATITATIDPAITNGTTLSNVATVTPKGGAPLDSSPAVTTINAMVALPEISKTLSVDHASVGATVDYLISVTSKSPVMGPVTLTDLIDPALQLTGVKVNGSGVTCTAIPTTVGPFMVDCQNGFRLQLPAGATLPSSLMVDLAVKIGTTAGALINNTATLDVNGQQRSSSAQLTVDAANAGNPNLTLTAGRILASKGDLVPFTAVIGVPATGMPLASPKLFLTPSHGLRPGDIRVGGVPVKPTEVNGQLEVDLPAMAAGSTVTVQINSRVNFRAPLGVQTLVGVVKQDLATLDAKTATVRIIAEPEFDLGTLVGEVFRDDNGNGVRDRGERPIEGALIVMDDGVQAVTDREGRYHIAAVVPGDRAIKLAKHTLPPDSRFTTDETRVVMVTAGILLKIDWGVKVPEPEPPLPRPAQPTTELPELRLTDAGGLVYRLVGATEPGAHVLVNGKLARVDKKGGWFCDVILQRGRTRLAVVTELGDGRVVLSARDVYWIDRAEGGSLIVPRAEEPRLVLRFPPGALAESTFQLEGSVLSPIAELTVAGQKLLPDAKGHVAIRVKVPEAGAGIEIAAKFTDGLDSRFAHALSGGGDFWLLVGIAEGKLGYVKSDSGPGGINGSGIFAEGRVKLYAKGRIQGRWLIEGGINLDSTQIEDWRDLFRGDPQKMFRNLDPDRFYTVYGDASTTTEGAPTRSRLFVRIMYDRSELRFGNFETGLTGVEFGRYSRAVTGGRVQFVRASTSDPDGPPSTNVIAFGAWLQTQRAHDELRGTGGSLFYLSHRNIVEGSEQIRVELRDRISERPVANQAQRATVDYEVDYLAGRVALREPLSSIANSLTLVRSSQLDGDLAYLVADYEYIVVGDADDGVAGGRVTQKIGPVRVGGTFVNEFRAKDNYLLAGGDLQVDLKKYGTIIGEYAFSQGSLASFARSDDGGLTYHDMGGTYQSPSLRNGHAWRVEGDLHFFGVYLHPYARGMTQGFTDTAHVNDSDFFQWGAELEANFWKLKLRLHYDERRYEQQMYDPTGTATGTPNQETRRDIGGEIGGQFGRVGVRIGARTERSDDTVASLTGHRTAVGARVDVRIVPKLTLYAHGQYAFEHDGQGLLGRDNSLGAVGALATLPWDIGLQGEFSYGVYGPGGLLGLKTELGKGRVLYGTVTLSQDRDDRLSTTIAAGGRERVADRNGNARLFLFAEDQFRDGPVVAGDTTARAHMITAGLDLPLWKRFLFSATFERGEITPSGSPWQAGNQPIGRTAATSNISYGGDKLRAQVRGEIRFDKVPDPATGKTNDELSWLASGMVTAQPHKDLTLRGKALFSDSQVPGSTLARSGEATVGFAWRPSFTDRIALFGRYTYLDEGVPAAQGTNAPAFREKAHVMSLAGESRLFWRISLAEKIGAKERLEEGGTHDWMILWVNRASLHVTRTWDAVVEYRLMYGPAAAMAHGVSIEANRIIVGHLRLGAGWNFADFSDDELRMGRGGENGFYVRAEGFY
jgi:uncharacterized repeat protein (TIGR01451 family)